MENREMVKFLVDKKSIQDEGFKFVWIFETFYIQELEDLYGAKMVKLEDKLDTLHFISPKRLGDFLMTAYAQKKFEDPVIGVKILHIATEQGFSQEDIVLIENQRTDETKQNKSKLFIETFKKIVANTKMIPDKSCILLSSEQHKVIELGGKKVYMKNEKTPKKMKKREEVSKLKGQQTITQFFQLKKDPNSKPYKKPLEQPQTVKSFIEGITNKLRGDSVKVIWIPKRHYELDPSQYISVFLLHEIVLLVEKNKDKDLKALCSDALDYFPSEMWKKAVEWAETCENKYLSSDEDCESDEVETGVLKTEVE